MLVGLYEYLFDRVWKNSSSLQLPNGEAGPRASHIWRGRFMWIRVRGCHIVASYWRCRVHRKSPSRPSSESQLTGGRFRQSVLWRHDELEGCAEELAIPLRQGRPAGSRGNITCAGRKRVGLSSRGGFELLWMNCFGNEQAKAQGATFSASSIGRHG